MLVKFTPSPFQYTLIKTAKERGVYIIVRGLEDYMEKEIRDAITELRHYGFMHQVGDNMFALTDQGEKVFDEQQKNNSAF